MINIKDSLAPGVVTGDNAQELFAYAKADQFALPGVNVTGTNTVNTVLETARDVNSPVIVQFSNGGAAFFVGKGLGNEGQKGSIAGAVSGAHHVHQLAELYGVPVILHTNHAARKLLLWVDGRLDEGEAFYQVHGQPLFSSHMIDLSEEPLAENIETCKRYLERMSKMGMTLEIELGVTGGEEDGVRNCYQEKEGYLQAQIGNPEGDDVPNKKYYDPRVWLREGEVSLKARLKQAFEDLNNVNTLG